MGDFYDSSYEISCPVCKSTKYRNPHMQLMVNICGHPLCDNCVKTYFFKESGSCPECDILLKRSKFRIQVFEDPLVEKEVEIRRKVMRVYNMMEEDFETLEEWNQYLEEIEEIVFNITNEKNKVEMEKKIEVYEKHHKDEIRKNYAKKSKADEELERLLDLDNMREAERIRIENEELLHSRILKQRNKSSLFQDLMASEGDASLIVQSHAERLKQEQEQLEKNQLRVEQERIIRATKVSEFSSGVKFGFSDLNAPKINSEGQMYVYKEPELPECLQTPLWDELETQGYLEHVRRASPAANAGGYVEQYACLRALQDFMHSHILKV